MHNTIRNIIAAGVIGLSLFASGVHAQDATPADPTPDAIIQGLSQGAANQGQKLVAIKIVDPAQISIVRQWIAKEAGVEVDKVVAFDAVVFVDEASAPTSFVIFWHDGKVAGSGPITKEQFKAVSDLFGTQQNQTKL